MAVLILLESSAIDPLLSVLIASPLDSHPSRDTNDTSNEIIQITGNNSKRVGNITNVSSSGSQQRENDTALAIPPVPSEGILTN